jgi:protein-tyrosine-phosphatase
MDFPLWLYQVLIEGRRELPRTYRTGIHCRNLGLDIGWFFKNLRVDRSDPTLQTRKLWQVAAEIRHVVTLNERSDLLVLDDPKPGFLEIRGLAVECGRRAAAALRWRFRRTRFARRQADQRLSIQAATAHSILFACKGNICRSPFAAEYARRILPQRVAVASAGYHPEPLRRCPGEAVAAAARLGIDLSSHRSAVLDGGMIAGADLIFVFDDENLERVLLDFPEAADRVFYVGSLGGSPGEGREFAIPDPWGGDAATFGRCYTSIRAALDRLMPALRSGGDTRPPAAASSLYRAIGAEHRMTAHQE